MRKRAKSAATAVAKPAKLGPGEYRPDPTEGIQRVEDLPKPTIVKQSRNYPHRPCPRCGRSAYRDQVYVRPLHDTCTALARSASAGVWAIWSRAGRVNCT